MDSPVPPSPHSDPNSTFLPSQPAPPESPKVFFGPHGLRAGWKYLLFAILMFLAMTIAGIGAALVGGMPKEGHISLKFQLTYEPLCALFVLLVTALLARLVDKKPFGYFGLPGGRAFRSEFWIGAAVGFGALLIQLCIMKAGGWFDFGPVVLHGASIVKWGAVWGVFFLCVGFFEEGLLRGYPQRVVANGLSFLGGIGSFWIAALLFSIMFAALHVKNAGETPFGIFMVFMDGMVMCFSLWRTGNMWFAVGNHAAWDWAQSYFFGTPDSGSKPVGALFSPTFHGPALLSGGNAGPEGSVLVLLSVGLIAAAVAVIYRNRKYPLLSDEEGVVVAVEVAPPLSTPSPEI